ncbi:MAG: RagB/SusD family nutrient uptake outer membrane protein, partial [Bacteroidota bacterium]|nr:RagB/SusD family nutrient uptake outer membrane protein [Bacteroidota bacterium]
MKIIITILLMGLMFSTSCNKDILDKVPLDIISDATVWNDESLIDAYLTQTYYQTYVFVLECTKADMWGVPIDGLIGAFGISQISDEAMYGWWITTLRGYIYKFGNLKNDGGVLEWWEDSYKVIRALNVFLQKIPLAPVDKDFVKQRVAEARFLRAYNYFAMVKRYGGVPLITEPQDINDPVDKLYPKRATEQVVYDFILSEIDKIYNDLPSVNSTNDYGRPTKYAALALQCRAALYAGSIAKFGTVQLDGVVGINSAQANSYYQKAYDAANLIIGSGLYKLYNQDADKTKNFKNIFLVKNNSEAIF